MLLAKSAGPDGVPETLADHTLAVVYMAQELCERLPLSAETRTALRRKLELAAALHDIGKAAPGFQRVLRGEQPDWHGWRHEVLSAGFASALKHTVSEEIIFAVLFHHKEIPGDFAKGTLYFRNGQPDAWLRMLHEWRECEQLAQEFWSQLCADIRHLEYIDAAEVSQVNLSRAWLDDSPTNGQCKSISPERRYEASRLRGLLICADHLASARQQLPPMVSAREFRMKYDPRPFQEKAGATRGHAILRAPTGSGKTEAALLWAAANQIENARLFYVLPYTAAINAMHSRLQDSFPCKREAVGVLHGKASHHLFAQMLQDYPFDRHRAQSEALARTRLAREMYHPVRVCTPHQLLRYTLHGRGWEQMLAEFPGACVILDEIHSYRPDLAGLTLGTARLLANRFGARILVSSATLPQFLQMIIQELFSSVVIEPDSAALRDRELVERKRHSVRITDGNILSAIDDISSDALAGRSALVVCNHVRTAQVVHQSLATKLLSDDVVLFHGRFNMEDRRRIEQKLTTSPLPKILVATQVVEVSLDMDFDSGYFEPAAIDALIQRMGRVNRRGDRAPAPVVIFSQSVGKYPVYEGALTEKTLEVLASVSNPLAEHDVVAACNRVYGSGYTADQRREFEERLSHPYFAEFDKRLLAGRSEQWVEQVIEETEGRADVLPRSLLSRHRVLSDKGLWLEADALLVNIRTAAYQSRIDWTHDPPLVNAAYDSREGLQ